MKKLCGEIEKKKTANSSIVENLNCCFDAHFDLVTIHPFYDGNGRTNRLLMNYMQIVFNLPMGIVFKEDKAAYFDSLIQTRKLGDIKIFRAFMYAQYQKSLLEEIAKAEALNKTSKGNNYSFVF